MKELLKNILNVYVPRVLFGDAYANRRINLKTKWQIIFFQKVLRINSDIPWPVHWTSIVKCPSKVEYNSSGALGYSCGNRIDARNGIKIGKNTIIAYDVKLISKNHNMNQFEVYEENDPIVIGDNCWLGAGVTILPGVKLGNHVIVAAGSVVTKKFNENNILIGGLPARIIKKIPNYGDQ